LKLKQENRQAIQPKQIGSTRSFRQLPLQRCYSETDSSGCWISLGKPNMQNQTSLFTLQQLPHLLLQNEQSPPVCRIPGAVRPFLHPLQVQLPTSSPSSPRPFPPPVRQPSLPPPPAPDSPTSRQRQRRSGRGRGYGGSPAADDGLRHLPLPRPPAAHIQGGAASGEPRRRQTGSRGGRDLFRRCFPPSSAAGSSELRRATQIQGAGNILLPRDVGRRRAPLSSGGRPPPSLPPASFHTGHRRRARPSLALSSL
jgi:hypothetical protein